MICFTFCSTAMLPRGWGYELIDSSDVYLLFATAIDFPAPKTLLRTVEPEAFTGHLAAAAKVRGSQTLFAFLALQSAAQCGAALENQLQTELPVPRRARGGDPASVR